MKRLKLNLKKDERTIYDLRREHRIKLSKEDKPIPLATLSYRHKCNNGDCGLPFTDITCKNHPTLCVYCDTEAHGKSVMSPIPIAHSSIEATGVITS